jgi:hypothetical protein
MINDHIYWTFSAAAQCISAFIAFLLAGYALVYTLTDAAKEKDDSLDEIYFDLRLSYHRRLTFLVFITGCAIIFSLATVYFNQTDLFIPGLVIIVVSIFDLIAVVGGLVFVVSIVDPRKYEKAAKKAFNKVRPAIEGSAVAVPTLEFFEVFVHLEKIIRDVLKKKDSYIPSLSAPRMSFSFRKMVEMLYQNEIIDSQFYDELLEISRYRNLVFHGHINNINGDMLRRVHAAVRRMEHST